MARPPVRRKSDISLPSVTRARKFVTDFKPGEPGSKDNVSVLEGSNHYLTEEVIHPADRAFALAAQSAIIQKFESAARKRQRIQASFQFRVVSPDGRIRLVNHVLAHQDPSTSDGHQVSITETDLTNFATVPVKTVRVFEKDDMENATILKLEGFEQSNSDLCPYSNRQLEILKLLAEGKKTAEISNSLFISVDTVRTHRQHILQRSVRSNMTATVVDCVRKGWI